MSVFSDRLQEQRKAKGYTQENFCEIIGISRDTLSKWENGSRSPKIDQLLTLCETLECDPDYLLGRIEHTRNNMQIASDVTGLTEDAIKTIRSIRGDVCCDFLKDAGCEPDSLRIDDTYVPCIEELLKRTAVLDDIYKALTYSSTHPFEYNYHGNSYSVHVSNACLKAAYTLDRSITAPEDSHIINDLEIYDYAIQFTRRKLELLQRAVLQSTK